MKNAQFAPWIGLVLCFILPRAADAARILPWWDEYGYWSSGPSRPRLTDSELRTLDQEKAKDYAFMAARPWLQIQGKHHNPAALRVLADIVAGRTDAALIADLARKWDDAYRDEVCDALSWCECPAQCSASEEARKYWDRQAENIWIGRLRYSDRVKGGATFDEIRAWAYFWRTLPGEAYDPNKQFQDAIFVPTQGASWGQIKAPWR